MDFHQHSKAIVEDYLGTVAYVDDLIFSNNIENKAIKLGKIEVKEVAAVENTVKVESVPEKQERQLRPNIDPLKFINGFLNKGIHCALLEVTNDDDPLEPIKQILKKTDVAILDWQMHGDSGNKAIELLLSLLPVSEKSELRLIIIYTEEPNFASILPEIIQPKLVEIGIINGVLDDSNCKYMNGHTKIVVLKKENGKKADFSVSVEELPDKIIEEFTEITKGLVSNTVLKAVSIIRKNSHNLLGTFNMDLDAAYLNHRAFLESPSDSELHMVNWISDEMKDLLFVNKVSDQVNIDNVKKRLHSYGVKEYPIFDKNGSENKRITDEMMINLLEKGCSEYNKENTKNGKAIPQTWFNHFHKSFPKILTNVNERFAVLSSLSSSSFNHNLDQLLTLGSIIRNDDSILVCIQPSCDSYRLKVETKFIFLKAVETTDNFDLVIPDGKKFLKLSILYKSDNIVLIPFIPKNGVITSKSNDLSKIFEDSSSNKYVWLGNLKYQFAQRIANEFASQISRVGLDESEWLRRWSDK